MTTPNHLSVWLTAGLLAGAVAAHGQTAPTTGGAAATATSANRSGGDDTVTLSPFVVATQRDSGFVAASALSGGRLSVDLRDTAVDYSVQTRDFLDALNITNLSEAAGWTVNSYDTGDDGRDTGFGLSANSQIRFRGLAANTQQIDFFPADYNFDTFSIERLDYARGASGVLFGTGSFSGTPNAVLKRARTDKNMTEVRLTGGSWDLYRATIDTNYVFSPKFAVRLNLLGQDSHTYRNSELNDRRAISLGGTYRPWKGASISLVGETGKLTRNLGATQLRDFFTGWTGKTFTGPMGARASSGQYPTSNPNAAQAGVGRLGSDTAAYYVVDTSNPGAALMNRANTARTLASAENSRGPTGTSVGGVFLAADATDPGLRGVNIINGASRPPGMYDFVLANSNYRTPSREVTLLSKNPNNITDYDNITLTANQQVGQHLFLEAAGNFTDRTTVSKTTVTGTLPIYIDINRDLPDGTPNPNFLQAYTDRGSAKIRSRSITRNARAGAALVFNDTRWGDYTFSLSSTIGWIGNPASEQLRVLHRWQGKVSELAELCSTLATTARSSPRRSRPRPKITSVASPVPAGDSARKPRPHRPRRHARVRARLHAHVRQDRRDIRRLLRCFRW